MTPENVVVAFWEAMQSNDFEKASEWLSVDYEGYWPQSSELIFGRENFGVLGTSPPNVTLIATAHASQGLQR